MNLESHLNGIEKAIEELMVFHDRTAAPAPIQHQYIGTIIDNTVALLMAPANSIDGGSRRVTFSENRNWLSLMQAVHRSFFASIQLATEVGLEQFCKEQSVCIEARQGRKMLAHVQKIEDSGAAVGDALSSVASLRRHFEAYRPMFSDCLEAVLSATHLTNKDKKVWRRFFRALSIVRNKASHSDTSLTENERSELGAGGCAPFVAEDGTLIMNPRMYAQVVHFTLQFFDVAYKASASRDTADGGE